MLRLMLFVVLCACAALVGLDGPVSAHDDAWKWERKARFGPWSRPVNLGPIVNSGASENSGAISSDGLSFYFYSPRSGGLGGPDIWVTWRLAVDLPWETPVNLGAPVNGSFADVTPSLSPDGRYLFFASNRPNGMGGQDLYVSARRKMAEGFVWTTPVALSSVNGPLNDVAPVYIDPPHGRPQLYFVVVQTGVASDIYMSELREDGTWDTANPVSELNTPNHFEGHPTIRADGLEILFHRDDGGQEDIYVARREHVWEAWSTPEKISGAVNTPGFEFQPALSRSGRTLYFSSFVDGHLDLYASTRHELRRREHD